MCVYVWVDCHFVSGEPTYDDDCWWIGKCTNASQVVKLKRKSEYRIHKYFICTYVDEYLIKKKIWRGCRETILIAKKLNRTRGEIKQKFRLIN